MKSTSQKNTWTWSERKKEMAEGCTLFLTRIKESVPFPLLSVCVLFFRAIKFLIYISTDQKQEDKNHTGNIECVYLMIDRTDNLV